MRLSEEKRPWLWLEVAHRVALANANVYFLVVGDGPLRGALEKRATALGLSDRLFFAGTQKAAYAFMAAFDLFLLTSRAEGLPNVLIESQAVGVPVVTTSAGGAPETVAHRETGWVMESDSPDEIAHRVGLLLQDTDWCNRARQNMPSFLEARFGLAAMLNKTVALYA
jgi:glycosyltransferase involved in cell wall biosynthesis